MSQRRKSPRLNPPLSAVTSVNEPTAIKCNDSLLQDSIKIPKRSRNEKNTQSKHQPAFKKPKSTKEVKTLLKPRTKSSNTTKSNKRKRQESVGSPKRSSSLSKAIQSKPGNTNQPPLSQASITESTTQTTSSSQALNNTTEHQRVLLTASTSSVSFSHPIIVNISQSAPLATIPPPPNFNPFNLMEDLKIQLKKATIKFDRACKQLITLDQHMNDLQNSYSNSLENDRKTFKILYRMQLATLEGTHNAYIEYIERQVEKIKKIKQSLIFTGQPRLISQPTPATSSNTA